MNANCSILWNASLRTVSLCRIPNQLLLLLTAGRLSTPFRQAINTQCVGLNIALFISCFCLFLALHLVRPHCCDRPGRGCPRVNMRLVDGFCSGFFEGPGQNLPVGAHTPGSEPAFTSPCSLILLLGQADPIVLCIAIVATEVMVSTVAREG